MKKCIDFQRVLLGTISIMFVMGFSIPAFAVDEFGNLESGDQLLNQAQSVPEDRIVLPDVATNVVTNGDFETGNLNGWTTFLTANGVLNPAVALFDTDGDTVATQSAQFHVGQVIFEGQGNTNYRGGGIFQNVNTPAGTVMIVADIAARDPAGGNSECGGFILFFDNIQVDSHAFGQCAGQTTERSQLTATIPGVSAGAHEVKIEVGRPFLQNSGTPDQYIDNVQVLVDDAIVGGEFLPIDSTALLLAGAQTNAVWIMSALAVIGSLAFGALYITSKRD